MGRLPIYTTYSPVSMQPRKFASSAQLMSLRRQDCLHAWGTLRLCLQLGSLLLRRQHFMHEEVFFLFV